MTEYLEEVRIRNRSLSNLPAAKETWREALQLLREDHWRRYRFDAETDLAVFDDFP